MGNSASPFFFPLRTNVQYFETPEGFLSLEERIKQAVILYDRVIFESGVYSATLGPEGAFDTHTPIGRISLREDEKAFDRTKSCNGFSMWIQPHDARIPPQLYLSSSIERQFRAEFHSLLDRLNAELGSDVLEVVDVSLSEDGKQYAALLAQRYLEAENTVLPPGSPLVQGHIVKNLFRDLVLFSDLECACSMDPLHAPMLEQIVRGASLGFSALEFTVPHCANLPWKQIVRVREDPAVVEFRQKLFEAEKTVRDMLPEASESEIRWEVAKILSRELVRELGARMAPRDLELAGSVSLELAGGLIGDLIPGVGTVETAFSVGKLMAEWNRERRSWLAVLMRLSKIN